jgi:hypothetical protein
MNNHEVWVYRTASIRTLVADIDEEGNVLQDNYDEVVDYFDTFLACDECERTHQNIFKFHDISEDWSAF